MALSPSLSLEELLGTIFPSGKGLSPTEQVSTGRPQPIAIDTGRLLGYRYDAAKGSWRQVPFQVDEVFARYLNNAASGFSFYSGEDQHTTYAFDREGFRYTADGPADDPCRAQPASPESIGDSLPLRRQTDLPS